MSNIQARSASPKRSLASTGNLAIRNLVLTAILKHNPIPTAYRLNYVANFYVGPLIKKIEKRYGMTRPEWIVLFCLSQNKRMNAQQISEVTGRPKTSISLAVKQLQRKRQIERYIDNQDGRRQILKVTAGGQRTYKSILGMFIIREAEMLSCLDQSERKMLMRLLDKIIGSNAKWARVY